MSHLTDCVLIPIDDSASLAPKIIKDPDNIIITQVTMHRNPLPEHSCQSHLHKISHIAVAGVMLVPVFLPQHPYQ